MVHEKFTGKIEKNSVKVSKLGYQDSENNNN